TPSLVRRVRRSALSRFERRSTNPQSSRNDDELGLRLQALAAVRAELRARRNRRVAIRALDVPSTLYTRRLIQRFAEGLGHRLAETKPGAKFQAGLGRSQRGTAIASVAERLRRFELQIALGISQDG